MSADIIANQFQQVAARLRQVIERMAEKPVGDVVGNGHVIERRFDVIADALVMPGRPLQLVQERDG